MKPIFYAFFVLIFLSSCGDDSTAAKKAEVKQMANQTSPTPAKSAAVQNTSSKVKIYVEDATAKSGEEVCMNVKVSNFSEILSMQYSTTWDSKVLEYKGVKNFSMKDISAESFGRPATEPNSVRFLWYSTDVSPVTLFDGATIYQICFKVIGKSGTTAEVKISGEPLAAEVGNSKMQIIPSELGKGVITIE